MIHKERGYNLAAKLKKKHFEMDADKSKTFAGAKENPFLQITIRNFRTEEKASQVLMGH